MIIICEFLFVRILTTWSGYSTSFSNFFGIRRVDILLKAWILKISTKTRLLLFQLIATFLRGWL
uniref:Uncharacterized protein n=1 Tax=Solanum lycopersicum TaxID=4081 RepID=A0A3Q7FG76_SOLLC